MYEEDLRAAKFVLVDHYKPTHPKIHKDQVVAIFDHHMDYTDVPASDMPAAHSKYSRIKPYGSSATVVSEFVFENIDKQPDPSIVSIADMAVLRLLHGPIYLDTENLKEDKADSQDIAMTKRIEALLRIPESDRDSMYQALGAALVDLTGLNPTQILRKDLKIASLKVATHDSPYNLRIAVPYMPMAPLV